MNFNRIPSDIGALLIIFSLAIPVVAQATIFKCSYQDGHIEFTDVRPSRGKCKEVNLQPVDIGMSEDQTLANMGDPSRITFVKTKAGKTATWYYLNGMIVTLENGRVIKVEKR